VIYSNQPRATQRDNRSEYMRELLLIIFQRKLYYFGVSTQSKNLVS
jgi:hypothetical protein